MTEAATTTTTVIAPPLPLTTVENLFTATHYWIYDFHRTISIFAGTMMAAWLYNKHWINRKFYPSMQMMQEKTILITDGHTGIGYETTKDLLRRGARVVITCSDMLEGRRAVRQLYTDTECPKENLHLMECDLCSLDSIRQFAKIYNSEEARLDVLICNANLTWSTDIVTIDGFNTIVQANYLGHFLLTNLLLEKLKQCRPSRVINVSSSAHRIVRTIDWPDALTQFNNSRIWGGYSTSKLFQILSSLKLKEDLSKEGVNVFAVTPGWVWTSTRLSLIEAIGFYPFLIVYPILRLIRIAFGKKPKTGAQTSIYCAVEPLLENSPDLYFEHCGTAQPSWLSTHPPFADQLWKLSCEAVKI